MNLKQQLAQELDKYNNEQAESFKIKNDIYEKFITSETNKLKEYFARQQKTFKTSLENINEIKFLENIKKLMFDEVHKGNRVLEISSDDWKDDMNEILGFTPVYSVKADVINETRIKEYLKSIKYKDKFKNLKFVKVTEKDLVSYILANYKQLQASKNLAMSKTLKLSKASELFNSHYKFYGNDIVNLRLKNSYTDDFVSKLVLILESFLDEEDLTFDCDNETNPDSYYDWVNTYQIYLA